MDAAERELFVGAVRRATDSATGAVLDEALTDLGWADALESDRAEAVGVLFEAQGAAGVTSAALDLVMATALGMPDPGAAALVLPPLRRRDAPGRLGSGRCTVRGTGTAALSRRGRAVVVASTTHGAAEAVAIERSALEVAPVRGLDPDLGLVVVTGDFVAGDRESLGPVDWDLAVAAGQLERIQFGRPIAAFQAVRHHLAEALVSLEAASALATAAWEEPNPGTAALAKGLAGRSARTVVRHAQQVLAGIGFTLEHPLHRYVRRTMLLDQLLGAGAVLTRQSGADLLATGALPATLPL